eukprot:gnl/Ergobibamus_cyprinoides/1278.p1 GENE.gnl/Ergobibamus_cyprinoides/1278~~gnl/Ergobibamus_cyprinoides/1278.p1  ORF type:complete len:346 (+),score=109.05 gnl/Ergobibamus_cyprinoides/1278:399-1436(+)
MLGLAIPGLDPSVWFHGDPDYPSPPLTRQSFLTLLSTLVWNMSGFDTLGAVAGEVKNPSVTYPVSLSATVVLIAASYLIPLAVGASVLPNPAAWEDGTFADIAGILGGPALRFATIIGGALSSVAILNAAIGCTGRELFAIANRGLLPFSDRLAVRNRDGTPAAAVIAQALLSLPFLFLPFEFLINADGVLTSLTLVLELAAYVHSRSAALRRRKFDDALTSIPEFDESGSERTASVSSHSGVEPPLDSSCSRSLSNVADLCPAPAMLSSEPDGFEVPWGHVGTCLVVLPPMLVSLALLALADAKSLIATGASLILITFAALAALHRTRHLRRGSDTPSLPEVHV